MKSKLLFCLALVLAGFAVYTCWEEVLPLPPATTPLPVATEGEKVVIDIPSPEQKSPKLDRSEVQVPPVAVVVQPAKPLPKVTSEKPEVAPVIPEQNPEPPQLSETVRVDGLFATASGGTPRYSQQIAFLQTVGNNLNRTERAKLYEFLREAPNDRYTLHVKDRVMMKLETQATTAPEYLEELATIALTTAINGELRGYTVQHLRSAYDEGNAEVRGLIRETLYQGVKDLNSNVCGTALLAMVNLQERYGDFVEEKIDAAVIALSTGKQVHLPSKVTAIQMAGKRGKKETLAEIRKMAENGENIVVKTAALAALGDLGNEEDLKFIELVIADKDKVVYHEAAKLSKSKIFNRSDL